MLWLFFKYQWFVLLVMPLLEGIYFTWIRPSNYDWKLFACSLANLMGLTLAGIFVYSKCPDIYQLAGHWFYQHRFYDGPPAGPWKFFLLFLLVDFAAYWVHRWNHEVRALWALHSVHHVSHRLYFTAGVVAPLFRVPFLFLAVSVPLFFFGFSPISLLEMWGASLVLQVWLHSEWVPRLGPLELVLNTPAHHRVHHAKNPEIPPGNYGGLLIVFDRLFGTFVEQKEVTIEYGIRDRKNTYNPVVAWFREFFYLGQDLKRARSLRAVWQAVWAVR